MRNTPPDYLASRLGIVSHNQRHVPYGWELPEEADQMPEKAKPERGLFKLALVSISVLASWLVLHGFGQASMF
jgi:hypothetical protein